jgi:hypothetical protein
VQLLPQEHLDNALLAPNSVCTFVVDLSDLASMPWNATCLRAVVCSLAGADAENSGSAPRIVSDLSGGVRITKSCRSV